MKVVIDISEELYKNVVEHTKTGYVGSDVWIAVANGTPLPKGHGDLIDRDSITCENTWQEWSPDHGNYIVCTALPVIPADK